MCYLHREICVIVEPATKQNVFLSRLFLHNPFRPAGTSRASQGLLPRSCLRLTRGRFFSSVSMKKAAAAAAADLGPVFTRGRAHSSPPHPPHPPQQHRSKLPRLWVVTPQWHCQKLAWRRIQNTALTSERRILC
jgi:hypothetical protein